MKNIHFTNTIIQKPYKVVWSWLSDPTKYPKIYPNWVAKVNTLEKDKYEIIDKRNQKSIVIRDINEDQGNINLKIGNEISRTRLFPLDNNNTIVIHVGSRWKQMQNPLFWFLYKKTVDKDFKNAKKVIENSPPNYST